MKKLSLIAAAALFAGLVLLPAARGAPISPDEGRVLVEKKGALLLDVRTREEFAAGHVTGAVNIPVQELDARLKELPEKKDQPIVVYCRSGARSAKAAKLLQQAGYTSVHDIGPMPTWK